jgi:hypothetical protein
MKTVFIRQSNLLDYRASGLTRFENDAKADCRKTKGVLVGRAGAGLSNGVRRMDGRRQASALHLCWDAGGKGGGEAVREA